MCECGCMSGNQAFRLKAPDGYYVIEFLPGCEYCDHGPGIQISHPEAIQNMGYEIEEIPILPTIGKGWKSVSMIKCGPDSNETQDAAIKCFSGVYLDDQAHIDDLLAEILGEELWDSHLQKPPTVIYPHNTPTDDPHQKS